MVPLLYSVVKAGEGNERFLPTMAQLKKFLGSLLKSVKVSFPIGFELDGKGIGGFIADDPMERLDAAFSRPFEELRGIQKTLKTQRIVVLVDDLDRCSPDKVVALLEAINLVMDIEGFIFVLALDYEVLVSAVDHKYPHVDGHEFVQKMVQLPFRVPPLPTSSATLLRDLIPNWTSFVASHPKEVVASLKDISQSALRGNPRQIKRLVNYVLLLERIVELRRLDVATESLVVIIGLQLAWPGLFREVQDAALLGSVDPFDAVASSPDPHVAAFSARHLSTFQSGESLIRLLQLTSAVETTADRPRDRARSNEEVLALLSPEDQMRSYAWHASPSFAPDGIRTTYVTAKYPNVSVTVAPKGVTVEYILDEYVHSYDLSHPLVQEFLALTRGTIPEERIIDWLQNARLQGRR